MGIRIISPDGQTIEVLSFAKHKGTTFWCWYNAHTLQHNLEFGKRAAKRKNENKPGAHLIIEFSPATFEALTKTGNTILRDFSKRKKKEKRYMLSPVPMILDAAMQQSISAVTHYQGSEQTKFMYLYARILDLLWLQQENYLRTQKPRTVYVKTEYDKERIIFARDHLLTHMDAPPTLIELAAIAGLNEFKLKKGFKELFNNTVFGYLAEVRLAMAGRALREKKKTISRIAFELGYASPQHFSTAFKKKYGVPPAKY